MFAHRGGSALAPENTLPAFDRGLSLGADGLELDMHLSRDGVVVVHHDRLLYRTTNLRGPVADVAASDLARADAGYRFQQAETFPFRGAGIGVPTLADVLTRHRDTRIIIEVKVNSVEMASAVVAAVRAAKAVDRVCIGSFALSVMRAVRALEPAMATSAAREEVRWALYRSWVSWPIARPRYQGYQVPERSGRTRVVSARFIAAAHRAGLGVQVWTVDTAEDARRLLAWGADALISDRPDVVVPLAATL